MTADILWTLAFILAAISIPVVLHEIVTGLSRFFLVRRRAHIFRKLRDTRVVSFLPTTKE